MQKMATIAKMKTMTRHLSWILALLLVLGSVFLNIGVAQAAGGISPSGGGKFVTGQTFTITVKASGATFDSLQGTIKTSGVAEVVSFSAGSATWLPGKTPSNGGQFVGIVSATSSLTVATIKLRASKEGSGSVSVSGVRLARSGAEVGTGGGSTSYMITRAPTPPGGVEVSSSTHPDQAASYEATTVELSWKAPSNGADGYSHAFDQSAETTPGTSVTTTATTAKYENLAVGTYYFHIRARNGDGWSGVTHFKITIKASINTGLGAPTITKVGLADNYQNYLNEGTVAGLHIQGEGLAGYTIRLKIDPSLNLDATKYPAPVVSEKGTWELLISDPVKASFYKLMAQGEKDNVLTPDSAAVRFEISVNNGGQVNMITDEDETLAFKKAEEARTKVAAAQARKKKIVFGSGALVLLALLGVGGWLAYRRLRFSPDRPA